MPQVTPLGSITFYMHCQPCFKGFVSHYAYSSTAAFKQMEVTSVYLDGSETNVARETPYVSTVFGEVYFLFCSVSRIFIPNNGENL